MRGMNEVNDDRATPADIKQKQQERIDQWNDMVEQSVADVDLVIDKKRPEIKVPVKVAIDSKVSPSKLPAVMLFALGNLSLEEYNQYIKTNAASLTINEITASRLLNGVLRGDTGDKAIYWRLQERILARPSSVQQLQPPAPTQGSIMSEVMEEIEARVFKNAAEGEVISKKDS